jgi:hypothetical protein
MRTLLLLPLFAMAVFGQSQTVPCGSSPAADAVRSGGTPAAAKAVTEPPSPEAAANLAAQIRQRPPAQPAFSCRCGTVGANSLTAQSNSQEIPILTGLAGSFRFDHVLLQETARFSSNGAGSLVVSVGRAGFGSDVTSPFPLRSVSAPYNSWYERPGPPQLNGGYDLVLSFKASAPLGDGAVSSFSAGALSWEVCGYSRPAPAR